MYRLFLTEKTGGENRIEAYVSAPNVVVDKPVKYENWQFSAMAPSNNSTYIYIHITDLDASFSQEQGLLNP